MMRKKTVWSIALLICAIVVISASVVGCGSNNQNNQNNTGNNSTAPAGDSYVLKMQTVQGNSQLEFKMLTEMADELYKASSGRLKIEVNPNGTFASSVESFQACMSGVFDICANYGTWLKSIDYSLHILTTGNMQLDPVAKRIWLYEGGGFELAQQAFDKAKLELLAIHTDGTEIMMSRDPYKSVAEMKGKKFRTSDARLMQEIGIAGVTMPLEELFTAFSTGAVDIAEYGYLTFDQQLGLTDVAGYGIFPDFWNVNNSISIAMNQDAYNKLPEDLQTLLKMAFRSYEFKHFTMTQYASAETMKELEASGKMQFLRLDSEEFAEMRKVMYEKIEKADIEEHGGLTKEMFDSYYAFMETWYPYKKISRWWGEDLTPEQMMGFDPAK